MALVTEIPDQSPILLKDFKRGIRSRKLLDNCVLLEFLSSRRHLRLPRKEVKVDMADYKAGIFLEYVNQLKDNHFFLIHRTTMYLPYHSDSILTRVTPGLLGQ
ncbi:hypothetical protein GHT06_012438 [Daphnia sinensis]|uniref:Uncharacterized protein n=1 Tax=Daphnia sinensis TaxID=1820382 RepID=A0AAD5PZT3_9CRUS|nr:hypothetical protein GHT06_012438 [Daphnia sinensis]